MASTDAKPVPIKNTAFRAYFDLRLNTGALNTGAAGLDSEVSKDAGTMADCTNEATEIATSSGHYYLDLTSTEMNADSVVVQIKSSTTNAVTRSLLIYPQESGDIKVDLQSVAGTTVDTTTAQLGVNVVNWKGTAAATVNTAGVPVVDARGYGRINTAQAGGANSITFDASASATTDFFVGSSVATLAGTGAGQNGRIVTAYNGTTKVATVVPAWVTNPSSDTVFATLPAGVTLEAWLRVAPNALVSGDAPANVKQINSSSAAAVRQALAANEFIPGTVTTAGLTPTTTQFECSDITTAAADHYLGREWYWTTGTLTGQRGSISAYSLVSGRGRFTISTQTSAPSNADTGIVV